jgi:diguanylate cyclase (GGDEF)-like protein
MPVRSQAKGILKSAHCLDLYMEKLEDGEFPALEHIQRLLRDNTPPLLEKELEALPYLGDIHQDLKIIREVMYSFASGDFSHSITARGIIPGCMRAFQSRLQHLIWQVQQIEQGDFSQRVEFMGEFSEAFNRMTSQLDSTLKNLKHKESTLSTLAENLKSEVDLRNSAMEALQKSESQFKYLASHDPLTGALNRRSFMELASQEINNAAVLGHLCGIIMMDIDLFKNFNDSYGHLAGDEALRHTVRVITSLLRKNDFLGRYGGEEFVFLINKTDKATGLAIAERIRGEIESSPVNLEAGPVGITASFGVAIADINEKGQFNSVNTKPDNCIDILINNADLALYEAKRLGRNRVVFYQPE